MHTAGKDAARDGLTGLSSWRPTPEQVTGTTLYIGRCHARHYGAEGVSSPPPHEHELRPDLSDCHVVCHAEATLQAATSGDLVCRPRWFGGNERGVLAQQVRGRAGERAGEGHE